MGSASSAMPIPPPLPGGRFVERTENEGFEKTKNTLKKRAESDDSDESGLFGYVSGKLFGWW